MSSTADAPARLTYSVAEVVAMTGLSESSVIRQIKSGDLPSALVGGRRLIRAEDLDAFIAARVSA